MNYLKTWSPVFTGLALALLLAMPAAALELAAPSPQELEQRVAAAKERLAKTEAGQRVWAAMEAHGGLERWFANGPIEFRFRYAPEGGERGPVDTVQLIDTWSSRAVHHLASDDSVSFGWDGSEAWVKPADAELPINARFWALTPYYFVGVPFVFGDPGVRHESAGTMDFEDRTYDLVRITFDDGTGDAPDDYYILLVDTEDDTVGGVRYVVSYPGFFPEGGHTPETLLAYDGAQEVDGIVLPETLRSFTWTEDGPEGAAKVNTTLSQVDFLSQTADEVFAKPAGAQTQDGY